MSTYDHKSIEKNWRKTWNENKVYKVTEDKNKVKCYVLDMFPYPSGAGLHVGHPLGYIASDIYARYKRHKGFNVLHPMGYDSFGLPAEQYAIQTGQHPAKTTEKNVSRYREQLDILGFSYDWDREVRTSSPDYYKWTQWIFTEIYGAWFNPNKNKAEKISALVQEFEQNGNQEIGLNREQKKLFTADEWNAFDEAQKDSVIDQYRLTYLAETMVNWCPEMGTVLSNDEVKDGLSARGGYPVIQKKMLQWNMAITAYSERLLQGLKNLDWTTAIKDIQENWIGKSVGAEVSFEINGYGASKIDVFTTRPDTIFGVSFMVLAPEHGLVPHITTDDQRESINSYIDDSRKKSERERQMDKGDPTGVFTGAYAIHPFSKKLIPIWIADYVLAGYGTGAVMAVPCGDDRDHKFAKHFGIEIPNIFEGKDVSENAFSEKEVVIANSDFLNGLKAAKAKEMVILKLQNMGIGLAKINYRLRDAVFSRQRYWGEPFPVFYKDGKAQMIEPEHYPLNLPEVDHYLPTSDGKPPLGNATDWSWCTNKKIIKPNENQNGVCTWPMELNTMPGWAGSSWYFARYTDPKNANEFASKEKLAYWKNVDVYLGGAEHATGHLLYSRFWTKILFDLGHLPYDEPFKKLVNQGMILGKSNFVFRVVGTNTFVSKGLVGLQTVQALHVDISMVKPVVEQVGDKTQTVYVLDTEAFKNWLPEYNNAEFILEDERYLCGVEEEKMSKSKFNVQTPDDLVVAYGADTLRMYEMFLGPLEQAKPWDVGGINGVYSFLKKFWRLFHMNDAFALSKEPATKEELKTLHKTIKKVSEDIENFSFNTSVPAFMIAVNELTALKCNKREILEPLCILLSPFAPHISEELWSLMGNTGYVVEQEYPLFDESFLKESTFQYPVSFNGKMRFKIELDVNLDKAAVEKEVLNFEKTLGYLEGKSPKKVIVVPNKIVNIVL